MHIQIYCYNETDHVAVRSYLESANYERNKSAFPDVEVSIVSGAIKDIVSDYIVAPGNSYGIMTGGFDKGLVDAFGTEIQRRVQGSIFTGKSNGDLAVGQAILVRVPNTEQYQVLVYAPTMRVPTRLPQHSDVPYTVAKVALTEAWYHAGRGAHPAKVIMPLLCVGTGGLQRHTVLNQIHVAAGRVVHHHDWIVTFRDARALEAFIRK